MKYYRIYSWPGEHGAWYLDDITYATRVSFISGRPVDKKSIGKISVNVAIDGIPMDYTQTMTESIPIVSEDFAEVMFDYSDDVELLPIEVSGKQKLFYVLNVKSLVDCVDEDKSEFEVFKEGNTIRPDLVGEYSSMRKLIIKPDKIKNQIFRVEKCNLYLLVSETVKIALQNAGTTGMKFKLAS